MNELPEPENARTKISEADVAQIKDKAVSGARTLALLSGVQTILKFLSARTTSKYLSPADFDEFGVGSTISGVGMYFTDVGLAGGLIQKGGIPSDDEVATIFWSQQILVTTVIAFILGFIPFWKSFLHLDSTSVTILIVSTLALYLVTLRVIPMFMMERKLLFNRIAQCELAENLTQIIVTIVLAILHFKAWALLGGALARGLVGVILVWIASPWRPRGRFRLDILKGLATFGLPFQLNAIIPSLGGMWSVVIVKRLLDKGVFGLVTWSTNISMIPMVISIILVRVSYPTYSRLKDDLEAVANAMKKSVMRLMSGFDLVISPFIILAPLIIPFVFDHKWIPAISIVQWLSLQAIVSALLGIVCSVQNALGKATERMWVTIGMSALRWVTGYWAISTFGIAGYGPIGLAMNLVELVISGWLVRRHNPHSHALLRDLLTPLIVSWVPLGAALLIGGRLGGGIVWLQAILSLVAWGLLVLVRELATPWKIIRGEVMSLLGMLRRKR